MAKTWKTGDEVRLVSDRDGRQPMTVRQHLPARADSFGVSLAEEVICRWYAKVGTLQEASFLPDELAAAS